MAQEGLFDGAQNEAPSRQIQAPSLRTVFTISCGIPAQRFVELLEKHGKPLLLDTRRAREYGRARFAHGEDLEWLCGRMDIPYAHTLDLAPTREMRATLHKVLDAKGPAQGDRAEAWTQFLETYVRGLVDARVLSEGAQVGDIVRGEHSAIAIMCACEHHVDCHRRAAAGLIGRFVEGAQVIHLSAEEVGGRVPKYKSPRRYLTRHIQSANLQPNLPGERKRS